MSNPDTRQYVAFIEALSVASRKMRTHYNAHVARHGLTFYAGAGDSAVVEKRIDEPEHAGLRA